MRVRAVTGFQPPIIATKITCITGGMNTLTITWTVNCGNCWVRLIQKPANETEDDNIFRGVLVVGRGVIYNGAQCTPHYQLCVALYGPVKNPGHCNARRTKRT